MISEEDGSVEVRTSFEDFFAIQAALDNAQLVPVSSEITFIPSMEVELDEEKSDSLAKMIERLEDLDDVQNVYCNA